MKLVFTEQAISGLQVCLDFFPSDVSPGKVMEIRDQILAKTDKLLENPFMGQREEYLEHLGLFHRRIVEGNYKIIYRIEGDQIIITDIFDSRQDPDKMKS